MELTLREVDEELSQCRRNACETDNQGQLVYYTGIYRWKSDNSYHDEPEPERTSVQELNELLKPGG